MTEGGEGPHVPVSHRMTTSHQCDVIFREHMWSKGSAVQILEKTEEYWVPTPVPENQIKLE